MSGGIGSGRRCRRGRGGMDGVRKSLGYDDYLMILACFAV